MQSPRNKKFGVSLLFALVFWLAPQVLPPHGSTQAADPQSRQREQKISLLLSVEAPHMSERQRDELAHTLVLVAQENNLDPLLLMALIHVESRYRPFARSSVGARGLMQIRVDTARHLAEKLKHRMTSAADLYDIQPNVLLGAAYFRTLMNRSKNDLAVALTAYNYGPSRTFQWVRQGQPLPQGYANRVTRAYRHLQTVSDEQSFTSLPASIIL